MSLDTLAERVMQKVPCPNPECPERRRLGGEDTRLICSTCHGTGTVLDPRWWALREALWKTSELIDIDSGLGFVRRTRAEAAYNLWVAAKPIMRAEGWFLVPVEDGWEIWCSFRRLHLRAVAKRCINPEDTLSAALLTQMDTQEGAKA